MLYFILQLRQLMIDLKIFEKNFSECFYLILLTLLKLLHICMIWLNKSIKLSQLVSVLSCTWKIKSDEILHSLCSDVCSICFKKHSCNHYALKLHRNHISDFDSKFVWYVYIFDTWSIVWDNNFCDKTHNVWACFEKVVLHQ